MKRHIEELPYGTTLYTQLSEFRNPARIRKNTVRERPFEDDPYTCMQTNLIEDTAMKFRIFLLLCASLWGWNVRGQSVALKTNVLSDAFLNINLGMETGLAPKWTLDITGDFNAWTLSHGRRWKHWLVRPEARLWFCDRFAGHFIGFHAHGGQYNIGGVKNGISFLGSDLSKPSDYRYQGWFIGAGVAYGYAWILGRHWNLEAEIGVGYAYTQYDSFRCVGCGKRVEKDKPHHYVGPTKAAVNLVYVF